MSRRLAVAVLAAFAGQAFAATLQLSVSGADGRPAADVVLLVTAPNAPAPTPAAEPVVIAQRDIRFVPFVTVVPLGSTLRFVNRDGFDHHVRSQPGGPLGSVAPAKQFEFRLPRARPGNEPAAELKADVAGAIVLGCHLHNSMRGHVLVTTAPWSAVSDDQGRATITGLPDGAAVELRAWHPDQLVEQPAQRLTAGAGGAAAELKLNFTPRKRPPPRYPSSDYPQQ